ncbi:MAG: hypothetical protein U9O65_02115 [Thermotogota bacterium]|nr:hypothetical protein [Thermotogota bacterium]
MSNQEIAEEIGRTVNSVVWKLNSMGLKRSSNYKIKSTSKAVMARRKLFREWDRMWTLPTVFTII